MRLKTVTAAAFACGALAASAPAQAAQYLFSTWLNPSYVFTAEGNIRWAEDVKAASDGRISFDVMTGGAILPATGVVEGLSTGVAQAGPVGASYFPSQFPIANALSDVGFTDPDPMLLTFAYGDFMTHEAVGYQDWRHNGLIFGASGSTPIYYLLCADDVKTLADLQGKRLRVPGGGFARLADALGGVPVNIPGSEIYTAMERRSIDCAIGDATQLTSGTNIIELVKSVVLLPMNPAYITGMIIYNPEFWQSLTDDDRRLLFDQMARAMVRTQIVFTAEAKSALDAAAARGIPLREPDETLRAAYDAFVANGVGGMAEVAKANYGVEDPAALFDLFQGYMSKWRDLLKGVDRTDEAALTALVKANIFDTLDASKYGMD